MRHRVLIVDDSKTVRLIVRKAFRTLACVVREAATGFEGLAVAARETPDLILLDETMPGMKGVAILAKLKADPALRAVPVMMLTTAVGGDHALTMAKSGARDCLVKPFTEDALIEKCTRIIGLTPLNRVPAPAKDPDALRRVRTTEVGCRFRPLPDAHIISECSRPEDPRHSPIQDIPENATAVFGEAAAADSRPWPK